MSKNKARKIVEILKKDKFFVLLAVFVVIVALFFRTWNFVDRVQILSDGSRDVQVARYAADKLVIPQVGQFSSAGPFFYGPWWYWVLAIVSFIPLGFLTHWYFATCLSMMFVFIVYWLGNQIGGKWLGLLAALFAAISPAQIENGFTVWNPSVIPLLTALSLVFLIKFYKYKKFGDIFWLGFTVGAAFSIHFQSILVFPLFFVAIVLVRPTVNLVLKYLMFSGFGFLIPLLPLIYFDLRFHWYNFGSMLIYLLVDQYKIWVPNRWLIYIFEYWPKAWASVIGGNSVVSILIVFGLVIMLVLSLKEYKRNRLLYLVLGAFLFEFVLYRYYRGERFHYYLFFAHPSIILLTAWFLYQTFRVSKVLGLGLFLLIVWFTVGRIFGDGILDDNFMSLRKISSLKEEIYAKYPNQEWFSVYGCRLHGGPVAHPLALSMYLDGRSYIHGRPISLCVFNNELVWSDITKKLYTPDFQDRNFTTAYVFESNVEWWKDNPPKKGSGYWKFILEHMFNR